MSKTFITVCVSVCLCKCLFRVHFGKHCILLLFQVCFPEDPGKSSVVHIMLEWSTANISMSAEILDQERFKRRISEANKSIGHVFATAHRARIYNERFSDLAKTSSA